MAIACVSKRPTFPVAGTRHHVPCHVMRLPVDRRQMACRVHQCDCVGPSGRHGSGKAHAGRCPLGASRRQTRDQRRRRAADSHRHLRCHEKYSERDATFSALSVVADPGGFSIPGFVKGPVSSSFYTGIRSQEPRRAYEDEPQRGEEPFVVPRELESISARAGRSTVQLGSQDAHGRVAPLPGRR